MRRPLALASILVAAALAAPPARSAQYYLGVDVPTTLGGVTYTPNQIVSVAGGAYGLEATLPDGVGLTAIARTPEGLWLLCPASPIDAGDAFIETRDLVLFDPVTGQGSLALDGSAAGIPDHAAIDAVFYERVTGQIALSFDVPVLVDTVEYGPADLLAFGAGFSMFWSAAAAGVPAWANVVGAGQDSAGRLVLTFDVPVTLGGATFLPGNLVQWDAGTGFSLYAADPSWPVSSVLADFDFPPAAGEVPDGRAGSAPVTVTSAAGGDLTLSWAASCAGTDTDYSVYEGTLGAPPTSHLPITCSTSGATTWTFTPGAGNRYYYVVPRNAVSEGSYGRGSNVLPRPPSTAACLTQAVLTSCG